MTNKPTDKLTACHPAETDTSFILVGVILGKFIFSSQWALDEGWREGDGPVRKFGYIEDHSESASGFGFIFWKILIMFGRRRNNPNVTND